jgi:hypothetical protein
MHLNANNKPVLFFHSNAVDLPFMICCTTNASMLAFLFSVLSLYCDIEDYLSSCTSQFQQNAI